MDDVWFIAAWAAGAYLLGSASPGDLVARLAGRDIRRLGDGNPGTTNVYREVGPAAGLAVLILDLASGAAA